jgi:hypothetical protein
VVRHPVDPMSRPTIDRLAVVRSTVRRSNGELIGVGPRVVLAERDRDRRGRGSEERQVTRRADPSLTAFRQADVALREERPISIAGVVRSMKSGDRDAGLGSLISGQVFQMNTSRSFPHRQRALLLIEQAEDGRAGADTDCQGQHDDGVKSGCRRDCGSRSGVSHGALDGWGRCSSNGPRAARDATES